MIRYSKLVILVVTISILLLFSLIISYGLGLSLFEWEEGFMINETSYTAGQGVLITIGSYIISKQERENIFKYYWDAVKL